MLNLAVLSTNRLSMPDGSVHYAFYGLVDFLRSWGVDMLCVQGLRTPTGACLPTGQPCSCDGPTGIGDCETVFLVHDCSSSWALSSAAPHLLLLVGLNPTLFRYAAVVRHMSAWPWHFAFLFGISSRKSSICTCLHLNARMILAGVHYVYLSEIMGPGVRDQGNCNCVGCLEICAGILACCTPAWCLRTQFGSFHRFSACIA